MAYQLIAFDKLCISVNECITALLKHHGLEGSDQGKLIEKLDKDRRIQVQFLLKIIEVLVNSKKDDLEKSQILTAAIYHIKDEIEVSYKKYYGNPESSNLYNNLGTSLDLNKNNALEPYEKFKLYSSLNQFLRSIVYIDSEPGKGYLDLQLISKGQIKGYSVEKDIISLGNKLLVLDEDLINSAGQRQEALNSQIKAKGGYSGKMFDEKSSGNSRTSENSLEVKHN